MIEMRGDEVRYERGEREKVVVGRREDEDDD
jgi:hypothetical protein